MNNCKCCGLEMPDQDSESQQFCGEDCEIEWLNTEVVNLVAVLHSAKTQIVDSLLGYPEKERHEPSKETLRKLDEALARHPDS